MVNGPAGRPRVNPAGAAGRHGTLRFSSRKQAKNSTFCCSDSYSKFPELQFLLLRSSPDLVSFKLVGIDINIGGTRCHSVIYVLEQARFIVSCEGRNLPILITS